MDYTQFIKAMTNPNINQTTKNQLASKFPEFMTRYSRWKNNPKAIDPEKAKALDELFNKTKTVGGEVKQGTKKAVPKITKTLPSVGKIAKIGTKAIPYIGAALELPYTIKTVTDKNKGALQKAQAVVGNTALGVSPLLGPFGIPTALGGLALTTASGIQTGGPVDLKTNPLKELTPQEQQKVNTYNTAKILEQQAAEDNPQQFLQEVQQQGESIPDIASLPRAPQIIDYLLNKNQQNAIGTPISPIQTQGNITNPNFNLTPINEPPASSYTNQGDIDMGTQIPSGLKDYMNMIGAITQGAQSNTSLPQVGVTQEELNAYQNAINNQRGFNQDQRKQIEDVRAAMLQDYKNQRLVDTANIIGGMLGGARTETYHTLNPFTQQVDEFKIQRGRQYTPIEYRKDATELALKNLELDKMSREAQINNANLQAKLLNSARISNETGLPLNIVMEMEAKDYFNYLKPTQETKRDLTLQGAKAIADLIKSNQAGDILSGQQTQQQTVNMAIKQAEINKDIDIAMSNNATKLAVAKQLGTNSLNLEKLKQSDPNAYYRAIGNILMGASYYPQIGPQANQLGAQLFANILGQDNQDQPQQREDYYNGINFNY